MFIYEKCAIWSNLIVPNDPAKYHSNILAHIWNMHVELICHSMGIIFDLWLTISPVPILWYMMRGGGGVALQC